MAGGPPSTARGQRAQQPVAPVAAGVDRAEQQQHRQHGAQAHGSRRSKPGDRRADAQPRAPPPPCAGDAPPTARRLRIDGAARPVATAPSGRWGKPARALDAAPRGGAVGHADAAARRARARKQKAGARSRAARHAWTSAREQRQQIEQREDQEHAEDRRRAGQQAGQTRSQSSAARASAQPHREASLRALGGFAGRSVMRHLVRVPARRRVIEPGGNRILRQHRS